MKPIQTKATLFITTGVLLLASGCASGADVMTADDLIDHPVSGVEEVRLTQDVQMLAPTSGFPGHDPYEWCTFEKGNSLVLTSEEVHEVPEYIRPGGKALVVQYVDTGWSHDDECTEDFGFWITPDTYEQVTPRRT